VLDSKETRCKQNLPWSSYISLTRPVRERNSQAVSQRWIHAPPLVSIASIATLLASSCWQILRGEEVSCWT
jgi:hypothetical protein